MRRLTNCSTIKFVLGFIDIALVKSRPVAPIIGRAFSARIHRPPALPRQRPLWEMVMKRLPRNVRKLDLSKDGVPGRFGVSDNVASSEMLSALDPFRFVLIALSGWMNQRQLR